MESRGFVLCTGILGGGSEIKVGSLIPEPQKSCGLLKVAIKTTILFDLFSYWTLQEHKTEHQVVGSSLTEIILLRLLRKNSL